MPLYDAISYMYNNFIEIKKRTVTFWVLRISFIILVLKNVICTHQTCLALSTLNTLLHNRKRLLRIVLDSWQNMFTLTALKIFLSWSSLCSRKTVNHFKFKLYEVKKSEFLFIMGSCVREWRNFSRSWTFVIMFFSKTILCLIIWLEYSR